MATLDMLNQQLFLAIYAGAQAAPWQIALATLIAQWLIYALPLLLGLMWFSGSPATRRTISAAGISLLLALGSSLLIGILYPHPRPFMVGLATALLAHAPTPSFPSDHATVCFTVGFSLLFGLWRWLGIVTLGIGALVSLARVYLGIHYPLDILGGLLLGLFTAWLVWWAMARWQANSATLIDPE